MRFADPSRNPKLILHADDFGITPAQSERILSCSSLCGGTGSLNSLSVLVGSPRFEECACLLDDYMGTLLVGLHFNIVEGRCCAAPAQIPLLVEPDGLFKHSFVELLTLSHTRPQECRAQVALEASAQIDRFLTRFPQLETCLRIDGHQHAHMIPAVFDGLVDAIQARGCSVEYFRIPAEPSLPFFSSVKAFSRTTPVNWVKHALLGRLWAANKGKVYGIERASAVFCGLNYSGRMTGEAVSSVFAALESLSSANGRPLELLFHPGGLESDADCLNPSLRGFVDFYLSPNRLGEMQALQSLTFPTQ